MFGCTSAAKSLAYKALVRPCLEYGFTVWSPKISAHLNLLNVGWHAGSTVSTILILISGLRVYVISA